MSKRYALACLLAGTMLAGPALAQTTAPQPQGSTGTQTNAPATTQPGTMGTTGTTPGAAGTQMGTQQSMAGGASAMQPLAAPQPGQMLGSDLRGTRVYGANNENVGDISDIVIDRDGRLAAVIVGVGGFLGIGQKDVAVPFQALEIVANDRTAAAGAAGATRTDPATTGTATTGATTGTATTGATGTAGTAAAPGARAQQGTVNPDRIVLRGMTKADLENAPTFRSDGRTAANTGTMGTTGTGTMGTTGTTGTGTATGTGTTAPRP